jgi:two-component system, NtrC family, response regulator AtoC
MPVAPATILVGEDESEVRSYLETTLKCHGYQVRTAPDGEEVLTLFEGGRNFNAVLLDIVMPRRDGLDTLREIRRRNRDIPVIMLSAASSPGHVVEAMREGATDFLSKPASHDQLGFTLRKALGGTFLAPARQQRAPAAPPSAHRFEGGGLRTRQLRSLVRKVAPSNVPVLIQGETGTGKEVLARELHALSPRAAKPFVKLNCAAVPSELLESELFGFERGAFTGAFQKRSGLFEQAEGGTILLDEIGDMDIRLQAKLLQVLQDSEFRRLGGREVIRANVRVIAATHRDLQAAMRQGEFRADLFYRLNVFTLTLPSLRERKEELEGLAAFLIERHSGTSELAGTLLTEGLRAEMEAYDWPGNVRELENLVRRLIILHDPDAIARELQQRRHTGLLPLEAIEAAPPGASAPQPQPAPEAVVPAPELPRLALPLRQQMAEREAIVDALNASRWSRKQAAALLGVDYKAFLYKMKKLGIND